MVDFGFLVLLLSSVYFVNAIWPAPSQYTYGSDIVWLDPDVQVTYIEPLSVSGSNSDPSGLITEQSSGMCPIKVASFPPDEASSSSRNPNQPAQLVEAAVSMFYQTVFAQNIVPWKFHPRTANFEPAVGNGTTIHSISMSQNRSDPAEFMTSSDGQPDESYSLGISSDGHVQVDASSSIGIGRAMTTLAQVFFAHSQGGVYTTLAPVFIEDSPKFPHRGLNLDVSRQFYPVADIMRTIDAMAFNKLNRLHIHITDAQSWPLEVPSLPELSSKGAYHPGATYSPTDLQQLQQHGAIRGVETFIEVDMPGHTSSIWFSHPELIAAFNMQPDWQYYSAEPPSGTLKLNSSLVYSFLETFWDDILPRVSPYTSYFHTGGDEVNFNSSELDETVRSKDPAVLHPLLQTFFDKAHARLKASGFTHIVWEEMLLTYNLTLPSDVIVQSWLSDTSVAAIVECGHRAIAGNYDFWVSLPTLARRFL